MPHVPPNNRTRASHRRFVRDTHTTDGYEDQLSRSGAVTEQESIDQVYGEQNLMPGSLNLTRFAESLRPVSIVDTLPTLPDLSYPIGSLVVLTSDGKLYRNVADVWDPTIAGDDVVASSIVAGAVTAGALSVAEIVVHDGAMTLMDEFGETVMVASGFSGTWEDFIHLGLYNGSFRSGLNVLPMTDGRTSDLPYWTVAKTNTSGSAIFETTQSLTLWPGGRYIGFRPGGTSDSLKITSDLVRVIGLRDYVVSVVYAGAVGGSAQARITIDVSWYQSNGTTLIQTDTQNFDSPTDISMTGTTVLRTISHPVGSGLLAAPSNAMFAKVAVTLKEITAHSASTDIRMGLVAFHSDPLSESLNQNRTANIGPLAIGTGTWDVEVTGHFLATDFVDTGPSGHYELDGRRAWLPARIEGFMYDNVAAGLAATVMGRFNVANNATFQARPLFGRAGRYVAVAWRLSAAISTNTITLQARQSGSNVGDAVVLSSASGTSGVALMSSPVDFTATQGIDFTIASHASLTPAGSIDVTVDAIVEYEDLV